MVDSTLISILTGTGVAGVFCVLFIMGLIFPRTVVMALREENTQLKQALEAQRDRADTAVTAAQGTRDVLTALQAGIQAGRSINDAQAPAAARPRYRAQGPRT